VTPSVCARRRASISVRMSATRRPSLVVSVHMAMAVSVGIGKVQIDPGCIAAANASCGGEVFKELCYLHGSTFFYTSFVIERATTARSGHLRGAQGLLGSARCCAQAHQEDQLARPADDVRCQHVDVACRPARPAEVVCRVLSSHPSCSTRSTPDGGGVWVRQPRPVRIEI
jgi:hypothetical protein